MAEPLSEQIILEVMTRLRTVTVENGYYYTLSGVYRPGRYGDLPAEHMAAVVVAGDQTRVVEDDYVGNRRRVAWNLPLSVVVLVMLTDDSHESPEAVIHRVAADVQKAICEDADWYTFGGAAFLAEWGDLTLVHEPDAAIEGLSLALNVQYRHPENDPYTAG